VLDVAVAKVRLDRPCILAVVGQLVAGSVSQQMRVDGELEAGLAPYPSDHLNGHYTCHSSGQGIDLDAIVAGLDWG